MAKDSTMVSHLLKYLSDETCKTLEMEMSEDLLWRATRLNETPESNRRLLSPARGTCVRLRSWH
jgi:hypothetical protein